MVFQYAPPGAPESPPTTVVFTPKHGWPFSKPPPAEDVFTPEVVPPMDFKVPKTTTVKQYDVDGDGLPDIIAPQTDETVKVWLNPPESP